MGRYQAPEIMLGRRVIRHSPATLGGPASRTELSEGEEQQFQADYANIARESGLNPDPDHPLHKYDFRGAWKAGFRSIDQLKIDPEDQRPHWPSKFKDDDHPRRFINGIDTKGDR